MNSVKFWNSDGTVFSQKRWSVGPGKANRPSLRICKNKMFFLGAGSLYILQPNSILSSVLFSCSILGSGSLKGFYGSDAPSIILYNNKILFRGLYCGGRGGLVPPLLWDFLLKEVQHNSFTNQLLYLMLRAYISILKKPYNHIWWSSKSCRLMSLCSHPFIVFVQDCEQTVRTFCGGPARPWTTLIRWTIL
jgi:hypothetical protein